MGRIVIIRHGETLGESSIRYWGATDVTLSPEGRDQMRAARRRLPDECFDTIVSSPLARAWEGARIIWPTGAILLERDFCEIDFGEWEGWTAEEIEARNPAGFQAWREAAADFGFPGGERRSDFQARVQRGIDRMLKSHFESALIVIHHGVIRAIVEYLTGEPLEQGVPALGEAISLTREPSGGWAQSTHLTGVAR
jgi:broad specificity phosphatase PhoE